MWEIRDVRLIFAIKMCILYDRNVSNIMRCRSQVELQVDLHEPMSMTCRIFTLFKL